MVGSQTRKNNGRTQKITDKSLRRFKPRRVAMKTTRTLRCRLTSLDFAAGEIETKRLYALRRPVHGVTGDLGRRRSPDAVRMTTGRVGRKRFRVPVVAVAAAVSSSGLSKARVNRTPQQRARERPGRLSAPPVRPGVYYSVGLRWPARPATRLRGGFPRPL